LPQPQKSTLYYHFKVPFQDNLAELVPEMIKHHKPQYQQLYPFPRTHKAGWNNK